MIPIATVLMWFGAALGVIGLLGGLLFVFAWANDDWARRHAREV